MAQQAHEKVQLMCNAMRHGGPDDEGLFAAKQHGVVFGHRRLSIIDLSQNGHQPMADIQSKAWITFNGEIYNYQQLKKELLNTGAQFHSNTDTEVIIQAYLYWGTAAFGKLRGMFAFALYDKEKALTYLVRDSGGIKPLYYHIENGQLSFASEVKALKSAGLATVADDKWQVRFLAYGHIPEPYTTLKNVLSLAKGCFLCWDNQQQTYAVSSYSLPQNRLTITDKNEAIAQINDTLTSAITRQLMADAPIGVFLSGGIDSSLITLLANQQKQNNLKTISIFFDERAYDESNFQKVVLDKIKGDKFSHLVKRKDFEQSFPEIMRSMDMPTNDGINTWFISKYAHQDGLKAVLSGLGADELYGGYPSFSRVKYLRYLKKIPAKLLANAGSLAADQYKKFEFLANDHPLADYLLLRGLFAPSDIAKLLDIDAKQVNEILFSNEALPHPAKYNKEYAAGLEYNLYMQNQLLRDTDVMSMSHGLEVRVPFLDEDFRSVTESVAPHIRFAENPPKRLLIDSFKGLLPEVVWNRPKMGFSFPLQSWMQQNGQINDPEFYSNKAAQEVIKKFNNNSVHWSKSFALYQLNA